jgi:hypothetical protein
MKKIVTIFTLITFFISSCGTILYPERRGIRGGELDAAIVILDAVGLLFFVIPGIIAFAVDFDTGCIYIGNKGRRHSYNEKIQLDKNKDIYQQVNNILKNKYNSNLSQAIITTT